MDDETTEPVNEIQHFAHPEPIWRDSSDFIIQIELAETGEPAEREQLWARRLGDLRFELCCIPFFTYGLALGDVVETDSSYVVTQRLASSGRSVLRVFFPKVPSQEFLTAIETRGGILEWSSPELVAIDCSTEDVNQSITGFLSERAQGDAFEWENG